MEYKDQSLVEGDHDNQSDKNSSESDPLCIQNFDPDIHTIFIGHGVVTDLKVMNLYDVPYYDTHLLDMNFGVGISTFSQ